MSYNITQEEVDKLKNLEGEVRGVVFKTDRKFIVSKAGEKGVKKVEEELSNINHPFIYDNIEEMEFYSFGMRIASIMSIYKALNLSEEDVIEMGRKAPRVSSFIRFFNKHFLSIEKTLAKVGEIWQKHATSGKVTLEKVDEKEGFAIFHFSEIELNPLYVLYMRGYLSGSISMVTGKKVEVSSKNFEKEGVFVNEFKATWGV